MTSYQQQGPAPDGKILRVAAIRFLNPAPLMWDFEHDPHQADLANRYSLEWMLPAQCADRLALSIDDPAAADLGLIPVAALATTPGLQIVPGCAIASKHKVRSILLVHRANQPLSAIRSIAADTSSRASLAYTQILTHLWSSQASPSEPVQFRQHAPDLDTMLQTADAALLIGDPALYALEERQNLEERNGEELHYLDLAEEWTTRLGVPWVSAVWAIREESLARSGRTLASVAADLNASKDHGLANIEALITEWSAKLPIPAETIREYLTSNIFYHLDEACLEGLKTFYKLAANYKILPAYTPALTR